MQLSKVLPQGAAALEVPSHIYCTLQKDTFSSQAVFTSKVLDVLSIFKCFEFKLIVILIKNTSNKGKRIKLDVVSKQDIMWK